MKRTIGRALVLLLIMVLSVSFILTGCSKPQEATAPAPQPKRVITDQIGREVELPDKIERVAALHIFGAKIVYALGQGDKMCHKGIYGKEGEALERLDPKFAALPSVEQSNHKQINVESLLGIKPDVVFVYAAFDQSDVEKFTEAGMTVVGIKGETLEEAYEAVRLIGEVLECPDKAKVFNAYVEDNMNMVKERVAGIPEDKKPKVLVTGPKNIYTAATGEMLQNTMVETAGGVNVAKDVKGFWAELSPEQIVAWNPDYIFLASSFGTNGVADVMNNPALKTVNAVVNKRIYVFPSNISWWDFPLPQAMLGIVWTGKTINTDKFEDVDITKLADEYYKSFIGYTFTEMGGKLE